VDEVERLADEVEKFVYQLASLVKKATDLVDERKRFVHGLAEPVDERFAPRPPCLRV